MHCGLEAILSPDGLPTSLSPAAATVRSPGVFGLEQNYPNPFNPSTVIRYTLPARSRVDMEVFTPLGQKVATLVAGNEEAGPT